MRKFLIIANVILTIAGVYLTLRLLNPDTEAKIPVQADSPLLNDSRISKNQNKVRLKPPAISPAQSNILWERNLFHPDREYEEGLDQELDIRKPEDIAEHFELISIAQVADKSCASIRVLTQKGRKLTRRASRRRASRRRGKSRTKSASTATDKNQKVYMLNDSVGETGFKLSEIGIDFVLLKKNDQELKLSLDKGDEGSEKRRDQAKKDEDAKIAKARREAALKAKRRRTRKKDDKRKKETKSKTSSADDSDSRLPPPPPPPPPVPAPGINNVPVIPGGNSPTKIQGIRKGRQIYNKNKEGS